MRDRLIKLLPQWLPGMWLIPDPSLIWVLALITTLAFSMRCGKKGELDPRIMALSGVWGILGAHWGGHFLNMLVKPTILIDNPMLFFLFMEGEKGIYGALLGAGFFSWIFLRWKKASFLRYADAAVPAIALGYAVARIGCFLNGCCFGSLSDVPWAVRFPYGTEAFENHFTRGWVHMEDDVCLPVHPTQLYHAAAGLVIFLILRRWRPRSPGSRLAFAMVSYGAARFFLQFVRGDTTSVLCFLDISQMISLILCLAGCLLLCRLKKQAQSREQVFTLQGKPASHSLVSH